MKLYTQNGRWVGTQADAKREFGEVNLVDVPTDKQALLDWCVCYMPRHMRTESKSKQTNAEAN